MSRYIRNSVRRLFHPHALLIVFDFFAQIIPLVIVSHGDHLDTRASTIEQRTDHGHHAGGLTCTGGTGQCHHDLLSSTGGTGKHTAAIGANVCKAVHPVVIREGVILYIRDFIHHTEIGEEDFYLLLKYYHIEPFFWNNINTVLGFVPSGIQI